MSAKISILFIFTILLFAGLVYSAPTTTETSENAVVSTTEIKGISMEYFKKNVDEIVKNMEKSMKEVQEILAKMKNNVKEMKEI